MRSTIGSWLAQATLAPISPSKVKIDPAYDDRMVRVCRGIRAATAPDVPSASLQLLHSYPRRDENRRTPKIFRCASATDQRAGGNPARIRIIQVTSFALECAARIALRIVGIDTHKRPAIHATWRNAHASAFSRSLFRQCIRKLRHSNNEGKESS